VRAQCALGNPGREKSYKEQIGESCQGRLVVIRFKRPTLSALVTTAVPSPEYSPMLANSQRRIPSGNTSPVSP
jgi:hypothetical protein